MALIHGLRTDNLRGDLFGGVTAAIVALPLALAVEDVIERTRKQGRHLLISGLTPPVAQVLNRLGVLRALDRNARFRTRLGALRRAEQLLTEITPPAT